MAKSRIDGSLYYSHPKRGFFLSFMIYCLVSTLFVSSFFTRDIRKVRIFMRMVRSIGVLPCTELAGVVVLSGRPSIHLGVFPWKFEGRG